MDLSRLNLIEQLELFAKENELSLANFFQLKKYVQLCYGKRLSLSDLPEERDKLQQLIQLNWVKKEKALVKKYHFFWQCRRCHNMEQSLFAEKPCNHCQTNHMYCRKCAQLNTLMECSSIIRWIGPDHDYEKIDDPLTWEGQLTEVQQYGSDHILQAVKKREDLQVWAVTGSGKTEMLFPAIAYCLSQGLRICITTPRTDVVRELHPRLEQAFQKTTIDALYGGSPKRLSNAQCLLATTHQLLKYEATFDVIIIDEVDAFPYYYDDMLQFAVKRASKAQASTIYLTATPRPKAALSLALKQAKTIFIPLRYHKRPLPLPTLHFIPNLEKRLIKEKQVGAIENWLAQRQYAKRQLLIFVPTIQLARDLEEGLAKQIARIYKDPNLKTVSVTSKHDDRPLIIERFRRKEIYCLITTTILERGVTFPSIDVAVLCANHQVFDQQALVQISGRVGRAKDDPSGQLIFFHEGITKDMKNARKQIQMMNKKARNYFTERKEP
ncbi:MAG TPA: DEAD/DEAH box helicase [Pseudogracilibacillus sp.]|nr:DEAD/DEAH box helicase [Pseudogracilibacillus sp.]